MSQDEKRDVRARVRTYEQDGQLKSVYATVGTAWVSPHESSISVQIDCLPLNNWDGKLYINKPYEKKDEDYSKDVETVKELGKVKDNLPTDEDMEKAIDLKDIPF